MDSDVTYSAAADALRAADDEKRRKEYSLAADIQDDYKEHNAWDARTTASLPGTPDQHRRQQGTWRECASETESRTGGGHRRRRRWIRERKLDRAWQTRRSRTAFSPEFVGGGGREACECLVVVRPQEGFRSMICMDMEEVRACRDLGLEIPRDFTVEIPGGFSGNNSGANSPISGTGEDAKEIKAKLKLWAHAVAFVSAAAGAGN
ncbi:hypothetical protein KSP39_PZI004669 [Platanthera zijinensis]|uniref:Uncharacterized protein n=1 Tax=Platanthera zijinensis TaxID=2320716 RepID=A0AAP0BWC1_9ASPA